MPPSNHNSSSQSSQSLAAKVCEMYMQGNTFREIGKVFGFSKSYAHRLAQSTDEYVPRSRSDARGAGLRAVKMNPSSHAQRRAAKQELAEEMDALYRAGYTGQEIADTYGVSKQRVFQMIKLSPYYKPRGRRDADKRDDFVHEQGDHVDDEDDPSRGLDEHSIAI